MQATIAFLVFVLVYALGGAVAVFGAMCATCALVAMWGALQGAQGGGAVWYGGCAAGGTYVRTVERRVVAWGPGGRPGVACTLVVEEG
jgi:hypothetical protein